jgi:hypothetical protein
MHAITLTHIVERRPPQQAGVEFRDRLGKVLRQKLVDLIIGGRIGSAIGWRYLQVVPGALGRDSLAIGIFDVFNVLVAAQFSGQRNETLFYSNAASKSMTQFTGRICTAAIRR